LPKPVTSACRTKDPGRGSTPRGKRVVTQTQPQPRRQLPLPLSPALRIQQGRDLSRRLAPLISGRLELTITDNRSVMISVQRDLRRGMFKVRLHNFFADAPDPITRSLARYIAVNDDDASKVLNDYIDQQEDRIRPTKRERVAIARPPRRRTEGKHFDLAAIFEQVNQRYFQGRVRSGISWGRQASRGRTRRSVRVGSFCVEQDLIRIHPGLDQAWIPAFYIEWVVFHEMLHAVHPIPVVKGRRRFHTADFARDEFRFEDFDRATTWERANIAALLCI
jgi:hypothetical protein